MMMKMTKRKLCFWIILISLIGMLPSLLQYGCYVLATDMADQEVPFIIETKRMLQSGQPWWSWNHDLGDNFIGSYSFYTLTSPFVWLNCLFPERWIVYSVTLTLLLKMLCVGLSSFAYLRKMSVSDVMSVTGALMYTFSSFAVSNLFYYHFLEPMMAFPLLLIAIERYIRRERYAGTGLVLASFLVFFINYYFAIGSMIAALTYVLCRICSGDVKTGVARVAHGIGLVLIGALLCSFVLVPTIVHLEGNPRESADLKSLYQGLGFGFHRLATLFVPKMVEGENSAFYTYGFSSNAANVPVVGMLLAGLYVMRHRNWLAAFVVILAVIYVTPLNGAFTLFTNPSYTRWAYALTLFCILASVKHVDEKLPVTSRHYRAYCAIAVTALAAAYAAGFYINHKRYGVLIERTDIGVNVIILVMLAIQMALLLYYVKRNRPTVLLGCVVTMSMIYFPVRTLLNTDAFNKHGYRSEWCGSINQYLLDNHLPYHKGNFEWRTDFMAFYPNVSMLKNRPSFATFSSVHHNMPQLFKAIGCRVNFPTVKASRNVVSFNALTSVKEIVVFNNYLHLIDSLSPEGSCPTVPIDEPTRRPSLGARHEGKGYVAFDNKYYIPMGFAYDSYLVQSAIDSLMEADEQCDVPLLMLAHLVVPDSLAALAGEVMEPGTMGGSLSIDSLVAERRPSACLSFNGDTRGFKATARMARKNLLFFSVPHDEGFTGYVDGAEAPIYPVNLGLSAIMVDEGTHDVEFRFVPRGLQEGIALTITGLILALMVLAHDLKSRRRSAMPPQATHAQ